MSRERRRLTLPTITDPDQWAYLDIPWPMTVAEWQQMMAVLAAMEPGLVRVDEPPPAVVGQEDDDGRD